MPKLVSKSEFARVRNVDRMAVTRAVQRGRLSRSVVKDEHGHELLDLDVALLEWDDNCKTENRSPAIQAKEDARAVALAQPLTADHPALKDVVTHPTPVEEAEEPARDPDGRMTSAERKRHWDAKTAELKFREAAGELANVAIFEKRVADLAAQFKTMLLGVPSRAKQADPDLTLRQIALIESLIREALNSNE